MLGLARKKLRTRRGTLVCAGNEKKKVRGGGFCAHKKDCSFELRRNALNEKEEEKNNLPLIVFSVTPDPISVTPIDLNDLFLCENRS